MYPANFDYHRADSVAQAIELLGKYPDAKLLAGGHSLIPMMKMRLAAPETVIDIGRVAELSGICETDDGQLAVGALTTHAEIASSERLLHECSLLAQAAARIGDPQVRNKGTIGGNFAHADPASDLPAVLVALGATLRMRGPEGERQVAAADFFVDLLTTDLRPDEVLTTIELPRCGPGTGAAYLKVEHPASGYAVCGAAAAIEMRDGRCQRASLAFNGVTATPLHATAVGEALVGGAADDGAIRAAIDAHLEVPDPLGDLHASPDYRVALARAYGFRALELARDRALS